MAAPDPPPSGRPRVVVGQVDPLRRYADVHCPWCHLTHRHAIDLGVYAPPCGGGPYRLVVQLEASEGDGVRWVGGELE